MCMPRAQTTPPTRSRSATWYDHTADRWRSLATRKIIRLQQSSLVSEVRMSKRIFSLFLLLVALSSIPALGQNKAASFDPDGSFWLRGTPPNELSEFSAINLNAKKLRRLPSAGLEVNNGKTFRFKSISVKREKFTFTTAVIGGVFYSL